MARNWIGIRASAVVAILGSVLTLVFAGMMVFAAFFAPPQPGTAEPPVPLKPILIAMAAMFVAASAWGIATGIAIFLRRRWARVSIVVFAVLLTFMSGGGMLAILFVPMPAAPEGSPAIPAAIRWIMAGVYGVFTAIGVWWLVLFNRGGAREYFAGQGQVTEDARPLSVTVIAWYLLITAVCFAPAALLRFPVVLFGALLTGWGTLAVYTVYAVAGIYLGTALLHLQEEGRVGAIAYFGFAAVNGAVSLARIDYAEMMRQMQLAMPRLFPTGIPATTPGPMWLYAVLTVAFCAVPIFFLVRRRPAFTAA